MRIKNLLTRRELSQPVVARKLVAVAAALMLAAPAAVAADTLLPETGAGNTLASLVEGRLTSAFGPRVIDDKRVHHDGADVAAPIGTPIHAPLPGRVIVATDLFENMPAWGKVVVVEFSNGVVARFAHLHDYAVKAGQRIEAGSVIARVGNTGKSTGPHVHIETRVDGKLVDPQKVFAPANR